MNETHQTIKKRVTFKKAHGNRHIKLVLRELYTQVMGKDVRTGKKVELALTSLSKYPIHMNSGEDCFILQGFDKNLCKYVDEQLLKKKPENVHIVPDISQNNEASSSENSSESTDKPNLDPNNEKIMKTYLHTLTNLPIESLFQAILMKLYYLELNNPKFAMSKAELRKTVVKGLPVSNWYFLSELKKMKQYVKSEVVDDIELYSLTDKGRDAVLKFVEKGELQSNSNCKYNDRVPMVCSTYKQIPQTICSHNSSPPLIIDMPAGSYEIIMLVDKNEPELLRDQGKNQKSESRSLKVGDVIWVARSKSYNDELVLPYIVERKRVDDLSSSIKDGRFHEQKFRLRKCGLRNVIYLLEDYGEKHCCLSMSTLKQALANTRIQDGFMIHCTDSLKSTKRFLNMMTARLAKELEGVHLHGSNAPMAGEYLKTLELFNTESAKSKPLKCKGLFIKMLLQLKGVSVEKALAITKEYSTPKSLMNAYDDCDESREGELLLANLRFNSVSPRVGPAVSKIVYMLFNKQAF